jgi:hypothetical protein
MAIAFDAASSGIKNNSASTSLTVAHTCSGENRILFVALTTCLNADPCTGITYNGTAMTRIDYIAPYSNGNTELWYLINPDSGTHDIVASYSSRNYVWFTAASYTGALQSGVPDASAKASSPSSYTITGTVTTVADNCWVVMSAFGNSAGHTAGSGTTIRATNPTDGRQSIADSDSAKTPAGEVTLTVNCTGDCVGSVTASLAPSASVDPVVSRTPRGPSGGIIVGSPSII